MSQHPADLIAIVKDVMLIVNTVPRAATHWQVQACCVRSAGKRIPVAQQEEALGPGAVVAHVRRYATFHIIKLSCPPIAALAVAFTAIVAAAAAVFSCAVR